MAILLSFLLMASSAYAHYDELIEIDLFSSYPTFEKPDQDGLAADKQNLKVFVQIYSSLSCSSSFFHIEQPPNSSSSSILSSLRAITVLRC